MFLFVVNNFKCNIIQLPHMYKGQKQTNYCTAIGPCPMANQSCESVSANVATKASTCYAGICFVAYLYSSTVQSNHCLAGPAKKKKKLFSPSSHFLCLLSQHVFASCLWLYCIQLFVWKHILKSF